MDDSLIKSWAIHNRINPYLLSAIAPEALRAASPSRVARLMRL